MSKLTYVQEQVINTILHEPSKIRRLLANSNNPGYIISFLKTVWPTRVGVEIDTAFTSGKVASLNLFQANINTKYEKILRFKPIVLDKCTKNDVSYAQQAEIRVSVRGFYHIHILKEFTDILNKEENIWPDLTYGGLHIHIDMTDTKKCRGINEDTDTRDLRVRNLVCFNHCKKIYKYNKYIYKQIEKNNTKYKFCRDKRSQALFIDVSSRYTEIIVARHLPTTEWRLFEPTFHYPTLIKHIIMCHMFTDTIKKLNKSFNRSLFERIEKVIG